MTKKELSAGQASTRPASERLLLGWIGMGSALLAPDFAGSPEWMTPGAQARCSSLVVPATRLSLEARNPALGLASLFSTALGSRLA